MRVHKDFPAYAIYEDGMVVNMAKGNRLKPQENNCGYLRVQLCANGKQPRLFVHRLVAELYIENPNQYRQVNHIDGDKKNNHVSNLEWCSASMNHRHSFSELGRKATKLFEMDNGKSRLSSDQIKEIRANAGVLTHKNMGVIYGVNHKYIGMIIRGERR